MLCHAYCTSVSAYICVCVACTSARNFPHKTVTCDNCKPLHINKNPSMRCIQFTHTHRRIGDTLPKQEDMQTPAQQHVEQTRPYVGCLVGLHWKLLTLSLSLSHYVHINIARTQASQHFNCRILVACHVCVCEAWIIPWLNNSHLQNRHAENNFVCKCPLQIARAEKDVRYTHTHT